MARPPQADAAKTRARILGAASKLFSEKGIGATSMREIARAADVTQATVHHYYGSKDELHATAVGAMYAEVGTLREEMADLLRGATDAQNVIERAVGSSFQFALRHQGAVRMVFRQVIDTGELPESQRTDMLVPLFSEVAPLLAGLTKNEIEYTRMVLQSMVFLIVRFALASAPEIAIVITGKNSRRKRQDPAQLKAVETHLVKIALRMLLFERPNTSA